MLSWSLNTILYDTFFAHFIGEQLGSSDIRALHGYMTAGHPLMLKVKYIYVYTDLNSAFQIAFFVQEFKIN